MRLKKFIFTAQGYGFGPTSKASSIATYLRKMSPDIHIDFMGDEISFELVNSKKILFNQIYQVRNEFEIADILKKGEYEQLASVMEPKSVVISKIYNMKTILIDSLFWFWNWGHFLERNSILKVRRDFSNICIDDLITKFSKMHSHETQLVGHVLADKTFIQAYPNSYSRSDISLDDVGRFEIVGPILDDTYLEPKSQQNRLMISLCGQKNPEVGIKESMEYCSFIFSLLKEGLLKLSKESSHIIPILVGHPEIMKLLKIKLLETEFKSLDVRHLAHEEYYKMMNSSVAVIGPPSITTMLECYTYGKPYIFLPEQNTSHWPNYVRITSGYVVNQKKSLQDVFPGVMLTPLFNKLSDLDEANIKWIYEIMHHINLGEYDEIKKNMQIVYSRTIPRLADIYYRRNLYDQQRKSIDVFTKYPANGARIIAAKLLYGDRKCQKN